MDLPPYLLARVVWYDAETVNAWENISDITGLPFCVSVGFLVKELSRHKGQPAFVVLALTASHSDGESWEGDVNTYKKIPRPWVKQIEVLTDTGWQPYKKPRRDTVKPIIAPPDAGPLP